MKGQKTTIKLEECMRFGGDAFPSLVVHVHDVVEEDVDILQDSGNWEHGWKIRRTDAFCANFMYKVNDLSQTIKALEELVESLKEKQNG